MTHGIPNKVGSVKIRAENQDYIWFRILSDELLRFCFLLECFTFTHTKFSCKLPSNIFFMKGEHGSCAMVPQPHFPETIIFTLMKHIRREGSGIEARCLSSALNPLNTFFIEINCL
ncbi:hypothetical protein CEXT_707911 [Caerostris extrusa]|uniref:Uncharacterized protein n=1 Tax=Caerostris extrusa TaxID=172846 RepID=A0AAV4TWU1_CAEEX|nr:hypothetical protein CEXT_707911 [Caerostris extrusa]